MVSGVLYDPVYLFLVKWFLVLKYMCPVIPMGVDGAGVKTLSLVTTPYTVVPPLQKYVSRTLSKPTDFISFESLYKRNECGRDREFYYPQRVRQVRFCGKGKTILYTLTPYTNKVGRQTGRG